LPSLGSSHRRGKSTIHSCQAVSVDSKVATLDAPPLTAEAAPSAPMADRQLVDRCLAGDSKAWEEVYFQFHDRLLASIRNMLGAHRADPNLVDEIAARVWYAVVANDSRLLARFQPQRGCRLSTFLATIARGQAVAVLRSERRRRDRELVVSRADVQSPEESLENMLVQLDEFLGTLTRRERQFCAEILLELTDGSDGEFSQANAWQLRSRISSKLRKFVGEIDSATTAS
jgi:DNA-directed RNA polymerase specialized sigma24 family protein